jgi:hypothetical protein
LRDLKLPHSTKKMSIFLNEGFAVVEGVRFQSQLFSSSTLWQFLGEGSIDDEAYSLIPKMLTQGTVTLDTILFKFNNPYLYGISFHPLFKSQQVSNHRTCFTPLASETMARILSYLTEHDLAFSVSGTCLELRQAIKSSIILHFNVNAFSSHVSTVVEKAKADFIATTMEKAIKLRSTGGSNNSNIVIQQQPTTKELSQQELETITDPAFSLLSRVQGQASVDRANFVDAINILTNVLSRAISPQIKARMDDSNVEFNQLSRLDRALVYFNYKLPDAVSRLHILRDCLDSHSKLSRHLYVLGQINNAIKEIMGSGGVDNGAHYALIVILKSVIKFDSWLDSSSVDNNNNTNKAFTLSSVHFLKDISSRFHRAFTAIQAIAIFTQQDFYSNSYGDKQQFIQDVEQLACALKTLTGGDGLFDGGMYSLESYFSSCEVVVGNLDVSIKFACEALEFATQQQHQQPQSNNQSSTLQEQVAEIDISFYKRSLSILTSLKSLQNDVRLQFKSTTKNYRKCWEWLSPTKTTLENNMWQSFTPLNSFVKLLSDTLTKPELNPRTLAEIAISTIPLEHSTIGEKAAMRAETKKIQINSGKEFEDARKNVRMVLDGSKYITANKVIATATKERIDEVKAMMNEVNVKERRELLAKALSNPMLKMNNDNINGGGLLLEAVNQQHQQVVDQPEEFPSDILEEEKGTITTTSITDLNSIDDTISNNNESSLTNMKKNELLLKPNPNPIATTTTSNETEAKSPDVVVATTTTTTTSITSSSSPNSANKITLQESTMKKWITRRFTCNEGIWSLVFNQQQQQQQQQQQDEEHPDNLLTKEIVQKLFSRGNDVSRSKILASKQSFKHFTSDDFSGTRKITYSKSMNGLQDLEKTKQALSKFTSTVVVPTPLVAHTATSNNTNHSKNNTDNKSPVVHKTTSTTPANDQTMIKKTTHLVLTYERIMELKKTDRAGFLGLEPNRLESYLSDEEFITIFDMSRQEFGKLALWKQNNAKKKVGLF